MIKILLCFGVPDNKISLHFGVPDNQISLYFEVPNNQVALNLGVPDNCSSGPRPGWDDGFNEQLLETTKWSEI